MDLLNEDFLEIHFEIVRCILETVENETPGNIQDVFQEYGTGGLYELSRQLATEFAQLHKDTLWEGDWIDTVEDFINRKNTAI
jgi:hypothetical protein